MGAAGRLPIARQRAGEARDPGILASCRTARASEVLACCVHAERMTFPSMFNASQAREWYWEPGVGAGLRESGIDRRKVFLTSKLHPRHHGFASATRQLEQVGSASSSTQRLSPMGRAASTDMCRSPVSVPIPSTGMCLAAPAVPEGPGNGLPGYAPTALPGVLGGTVRQCTPRGHLERQLEGARVRRATGQAASYRCGTSACLCARMGTPAR